MTDKQPPASGGEGDRGKLPPRSGDWHSGLKRDKSGTHKVTADDTVSDFLLSSQSGESGLRDARSIMHGDADEPMDGDEDDQPVTTAFYQRHTRLSDLLIALLLAIAALASVVTTYRGFGHSWDEALYLKPAEHAAAWMLGVVNLGDDRMLEKEAVDRHWGRNLSSQDPLHPEVAPIPKLLIGAGLTYLKDVARDPIVAMRLPNAILFGLTVGLLFLLGTKEYGRTGGFAAAIIYALMPRVFGHAHIAGSETPLAFCTVLTVYCFLIANRWWPFALMTGVALGLALATKISALMLPLPLMFWGQLYKRRDYASNVFAMAFIAPLVMVAVWPWLWYDGIRRFFEYVLFYLGHQKTAVFYMNRIWGYSGPSAPYYYPLHIATLAVPVWVLFFLALGLLRALFSSVRRPVTILFVIMAVCWFGLSMLPNAPRYDGERLFFPAFAFLALVAGGGFSLIFSGFQKWRLRRGADANDHHAGYLAALALGIVTVYGAADLYFSHPNQLNYYNWITGRASGAYEKGFETAYWGEAVNEDVTNYLSSIVEPGDTVKVLALNELAFRNLRRWGKLPEKVDFSPDAPPYDYVVLQIRQGFMRNLEWSLFRSQKPLKLFKAQGVPRIAVYDGNVLEKYFPTPAAMEDEKISIADKENQQAATEADSTTPSLTTDVTTESLVAADEPTTPSALTTETLQTTTVMVLDLPTSTTETTATEERLSPVAAELLDQSDVLTSAPGIYEGQLPSTGSLLMDLSDEAPVLE